VFLFLFNLSLYSLTDTSRYHIKLILLCVLSYIITHIALISVATQLY